DVEPLLDPSPASLRGLRLVRLRDELFALPGEALELAHLLQEPVGALVLLDLGPLRGLGFGLVVAEDVARLDLAMAQLLAEREHVLEREIEREDALAHVALAGLDLLGDRDLLFPGEKRNTPHLLQVHPDRIGGLAGRALRGLLGLGLLLGPLLLGRLL